MTDSFDFVEFNRGVIDEFRANGGTVTGVVANQPLLLLTTTGAKSGEPRTSPLVYTRDGDRLVIIASKGGAPENPAWYHNLVAHPTVTVELPGETFEARAVVASGDERERLFRAQADVMPQFDEYQKNVTRPIPVVALERVSR
jgi:deazaflavin-dependent oxidoreductase (nitroreductase family)